MPKLSRLVTTLRTSIRISKSGRALAASVGLSSGHLSEIESGVRWNLTVDVIARLAAGLKVRPEALLLAAMESRDADQRAEQG